jgi:protein-ribulosamine 3-kinase
MISSVPVEVQKCAQELLKIKATSDVVLERFEPCAGGCINNGGKIVTGAGPYFIKWNDAQKFPGMFQAESRGLHLLRSAHCLHIPEVMAVGEAGPFQLLILTYTESATPRPDYWSSLGSGLASLHKVSSPAFGLDHNNFIGSLYQENSPDNSWINFFINRRLETQLRLAETAGKVPSDLRRQFARLYERLHDLLPQEKPCLLHGDLWNGNVMTNERGAPSLIDPAVYYGHREVDVAMTRLFGGFSNKFYDAYNEAFPLEEGFEERCDLYNLYPLLVHVNLFGGSYVSQVKQILKRFL